MNCSNGRSEAGHHSQEVYFSRDWSWQKLTVKQASCPWSRLNGSLKHGTGGAARCPAMMMSSIGALCGIQACHSFSPPPPPGVCCWLHPFTGAIAKTLLVETLAQTVESHPPFPSRQGYGTVTLKNSVFGCLAFSACPLILSHNTHSFALIPCGRHTPLEKSPDHSPHQHGTQVASHSLAFTRWNIPKKRGKTPGRHKFPPFLDSTSPLHSIPLAGEKTNSGR